MRQHRYRGWHKKQKYMFEVFGFTKDIVYENNLDSSIKPAHKRDDIVLMEYLELFDCHQIQLAEGDIVLFTTTRGDIKVKHSGQIKFIKYDNLYGFCYVGKDKRVYIPLTKNLIKNHKIKRYTTIWENPMIIKKGKTNEST